jgi:hypothetical protein
MSLLARLFKGKMPAESIGGSSAITGTININAALAGSSGRSMAIQAYIYDGESKESLEQRIDIFQEIIERQRVRSEIPELEAKRDQMMKGMAQAAEVMQELSDKQKNGTQLSSQERLNLRNLGSNIQKMKEEIDKGSKEIVEAKKKAGVR